MPSAAVEAAFQSRLAANWPIGPVIGLNGVKDPPQGVDSFLEVQYPIVRTSQKVLSKVFWEEGAARLVLNVKSGSGLSTGLAWADDLATLFRRQKFGGVETLVPSAPIVNDINDDGNWFSLSVIVPYRFEFVDV